MYTSLRHRYSHLTFYCFPRFNTSSPPSLSPSVFSSELVGTGGDEIEWLSSSSSSSLLLLASVGDSPQQRQQIFCTAFTLSGLGYDIAYDYNSNPASPESTDDDLDFEDAVVMAPAMPGQRYGASSASSPSLRSRESVVVPSRMGTPDVAVGGGTGGSNVKVVVRVRAFLKREIDRGAQCLISMNPMNQSTTLHVPPTSDAANKQALSRKVLEEKQFTFDNSFWSHDLDDPHYAHQEDVYNALGEEFLDHNFEGYHTCIFAYGQTGSGKSYTMMGTPDHPGLIPRTCEDLFQRIENSESQDVSYNVRVSYFEVYNEHVRDLLVPRTDPPYYLKIRESPTEGPYIKDLTDVPVRNFPELMRYMRMGDASRTTASTKMNDTSSRSHAVFTILLKQIHHDMATDETTERVARIRLVDLAGSERAKSTEATGQRLREGGNINKSLTTLGRVIAALADPKQQRGRAGKRTKDVVPYRDSILTWLLKDSLGGNSKTAMIACIAPSDYDETLSTLRYADQAKRIRTRAIVNQDHVSAAERDKQIADLQEIIHRLQLNVSQQNLERESQKHAERMEIYQEQVERMRRLMDETKLVSENKIRQLQTENEALRLHLKLAVDSIKNPIPEVPREKSRVSSLASVPEQVDDEVEEPPAEESHDQGEENKPPAEPEEEIDEEEALRRSEAEQLEMQHNLDILLKDLGLFRKKVADDQCRFTHLPGKHNANGRRNKTPMGELYNL